MTTSIKAERLRLSNLTGEANKLQTRNTSKIVDKISRRAELFPVPKETKIADKIRQEDREVYLLLSKLKKQANPLVGELNKSALDHSEHSKSDDKVEDCVIPSRLSRYGPELNDSNLQLKKMSSRQLNSRFNVYDSVFSDESEAELAIKSKLRIVQVNPHNPVIIAFSILQDIFIFITLFLGCLVGSEILDNSLVYCLIAISDILNFLCLIMGFLRGKEDDEDEFTERPFLAVFLDYFFPWMILDSLAAFPLVFLLSSCETVSLSWGFALNLLRFLKLSKQTSYFNQMTLSTSNLEFNRILKFLIVFLTFIHFTACFWIFISHIETGIPVFFKGDTFEELYVLSVYYAVTTSLSVGYGDIYPTTTTQRFFSISFMLSGVLFYSFLLTSFSSYFTEESPKDIDTIRAQDTLYEIYKEHPVSDKLFNKLKEHINRPKHSLQSNSLNFVKSLPANLRKHLLEEMFGFIIYEMEIFKALPQQMVLNILPCLCLVTYEKRETIVKIGEFFKEIEIVWKGKLEAFLFGDGHRFKVANIYSHMSIGEEYLDAAEQAPFSIECCSSRYEGFVMKKEALIEVRQNFAEFNASLMENAVRRRMLLEGRVAVLKDQFNAGLERDLIVLRLACFNRFVEKLADQPYETLSTKVQKGVEQVKTTVEQDLTEEELDNRLHQIVIHTNEPSVVKAKQRSSYKNLLSRLKGNIDGTKTKVSRVEELSILVKVGFFYLNGVEYRVKKVKSQKKKPNLLKRISRIDKLIRKIK